MNKSPAFQLYPGDFLSDIKVMVMSMKERGVYITLLCHDWLENGIPKDEEELKILCQNPNDWDRIWRKVGKCFREKNGKLFNPRLEKERKKQTAWKKKSRIGGIKSGESRRKLVKPKLKDGSTKDDKSLNSSSLSSSSTPSIVSSKKKEEKRKLLKNFETEFDNLWKGYPPDGQKNHDRAKIRFIALCKRGELEEFKKGYFGYSTFLEFKEKKENFKQRVKYFSTLISDYKEYIQYYGHKIEAEL